MKFKICFKYENDFNYCLCAKIKEFGCDYLNQELIFEDEDARHKVLTKLLNYKIYDIWVEDE